MAVAQTERVQVAGLRTPKPCAARDLVGWLGDASWHCLSAGTGSKGPRLYDWTYLPLSDQAEAGWQHGLLLRRQREAPHEVAYYRVLAPVTTPLAELVRVAGMRWAIEVAFEGAKQEAGLADYEVRTWVGWYRHVTLALLAYAYLVVVRGHDWTLAQQKKEVDTKRWCRSPRPKSGACSTGSSGTGRRWPGTLSTGRPGDVGTRP